MGKLDQPPLITVSVELTHAELRALCSMLRALGVLAQDKDAGPLASGAAMKIGRALHETAIVNAVLFP